MFLRLPGGTETSSINGIGRNSVDRSFLAPEFPAHHAHVCGVVVRNLRNIQSFDFLVAGLRHLEGGRQIGPELKAVHAALGIAFRHLLVNDAAARGHPLHVSRRNGATVPHAVAMFDRAGQNISNCFDTAVRVPGKSGQVILGNVIAEVVEQQERIEFGGVTKTEGAA